MSLVLMHLFDSSHLEHFSICMPQQLSTLLILFKVCNVKYDSFKLKMINKIT